MAVHAGIVGWDVSYEEGIQECYVFGPGEGVVIAVNSDGVEDIVHLSRILSKVNIKSWNIDTLSPVEFIAGSYAFGFIAAFQVLLALGIPEYQLEQFISMYL